MRHGPRRQISVNLPAESVRAWESTEWRPDNKAVALGDGPALFIAHATD